jgi:hypothetical protein
MVLQSQNAVGTDATTGLLQPLLMSMLLRQVAHREGIESQAHRYLGTE